MLKRDKEWSLTTFQTMANLSDFQWKPRWNFYFHCIVLGLIPGYIVMKDYVFHVLYNLIYRINLPQARRGIEQDQS
jgi:hypothetical protein